MQAGAAVSEGRKRATGYGEQAGRRDMGKHHVDTKSSVDQPSESIRVVGNLTLQTIADLVHAARWPSEPGEPGDVTAGCKESAVS